MRPFWAMLEAFGADLVLNGHEHNYEAFDPRDEAGRPTDALLGTLGIEKRAR